MKKARKRSIRADIHGNSPYHRIILARIIEQRCSGEVIHGGPAYQLIIERYSRKDGHILNQSYILDDEKDQPFRSMRQVADFIMKDAIIPFGEDVDQGRIDRICGREVNDQELWQKEELLEAWKDIHQSIERWLAKHGEPVPVNIAQN